MEPMILKFRWAVHPKAGHLQECFIGKLRLGAVWFDDYHEKWCSYFDNAHSTERIHGTEVEAKLSVETQASEAINFEPLPT